MPKRPTIHAPRALAAVVATVALVLGAVAPATAATTTVAADSFTRTTTSALGTADTGGAWTLAGSASRFSVSSGAARLSTLAGVQLSAYLNSVSAADVDAAVTLSLPTSAKMYYGLVVRHSATTEYTGRIIVETSGAVSVNLLAGASGLRTVTVPGLSAAGGAAVRLRVQAIGSNPTTVRARAWLAGTAEPTTWQASATDSTAGLQGSGSVGLRTYLSSTTANGPITGVFDDLAVTRTTPNQPPVAAFATQTTGLGATFDGTASADPDGSITATAWDFGDGSAGTGVTTSHTYAAGGIYTVVLTVTDDAGATGTTSHQVTVAPIGNAPPTAVIAATTSALHLAVDGTGSSDSNGTITGYAWDFGDGSIATTLTATHDYAAGGTFTVTLVVTDDGGATGTTTKLVTVAVSFTATASGRSATVDASGSSDAEGPIAAYAWDFGDGGTATGVTATHTYATDGTFTIALTVTDGAGATARTSQSIAVTAPASPVIAQDAFGRAVANALGTADVGGSWSLTGTASRFQVSGGAARLSTAAGGQLSAYLGSATAADTDAAVTMTLPALPVGGSAYIGLVLRHTATTDYGARINVSSAGAVSAGLLAGTTGLRTTAISGLTVTAGTPIRIRAQATGASPTTLRLRAWRANQPEPTTWPISLTDSTAGLQGPGSVGIRTYISGAAANAPIVTTFDDLAVTTPGAVNTAPTAAFTATVSGSAVSVDGSASSDAEGPLAAYAWTFGDGAAATGSTASHTYGAAGTYTVTLAVTDSGNATGSTSHTVSIQSTRPSQAQWLADVDAAMAGGTAYLDANSTVPSRAIVLDIDNTALQSYYQPFAATPSVFAFAQRAVADGYTVLFATGRSADTGGTLRQLTTAGYRVDSLCFRDPAAPNVQASKVACRAAWTSQGYTIVANVGNHTTDLDGGNAGQQYLLPNYGFLD